MYIVSYDITSNKLRRKIAKELENYGIRVQYSVFECDLDVSRFNEMYKDIIRLMENVIGSRNLEPADQDPSVG